MTIKVERKKHDYCLKFLKWKISKFFLHLVDNNDKYHIVKDSKEIYRQKNVNHQSRLDNLLLKSHASQASDIAVPYKFSPSLIVPRCNKVAEGGYWITLRPSVGPLALKFIPPNVI